MPPPAQRGPAPPPVVWPGRGPAAVQARPAVVPAPPAPRSPAVVQAKFLGIWVNHETKRRFMLDDDESGEIKAKEIGGGQEGVAKYSFHSNALILEHIKSHPEEGSGIGSLLMYLTARRAQFAGKTRMIVSKPANTATEYYAKMGFDLAGAREKVRQMYIEAERQEDIPQEISVPQIEADLATILVKAGQSAEKRWTRGSKPIPIPPSKTPRVRPVTTTTTTVPDPSATRLRTRYLGGLGIHKPPPPPSETEELQFDLEL